MVKMITVSRLVAYFTDEYHKRAGIAHLPIPRNQIVRFADLISAFSVEERDVMAMIDAYFDTDFSTPTDYRFGHFATDGVFQNLYCKHFYK